MNVTYDFVIHNLMDYKNKHLSLSGGKRCRLATLQVLNMTSLPQELQEHHQQQIKFIWKTYETDGFGFAFPKGSPLVSDVSRGVLTVKEGKEMIELESKWLHRNNCPDSTHALTSISLGLDSFCGIFTMAGAASLTALLISLEGFLKELKCIWSDTNVSVSTRITTLFRAYDQKKSQLSYF